MAEGGAPGIKRRKTFPEISPSKYKKVLDALNQLEKNLATCLVLLKIKNSNASSSANFSNTCFLEFVRSCDATIEEPSDRKYELYYFSDIFIRGVEIIRNFLETKKVPEEKAECVALENLINVIDNSEEISRKLVNFLESDKDEGERETLWSIELAEHLLKELAVSKSYVIDHDSTIPRKAEKCFCGEKINGEFGDCSIGSKAVWHGRLDSLLGSRDVALKVVTYEEEDSDTEEDSDRSSFEIKSEDTLKSNYNQILAETTVFAFLQKKYNPYFENFLIPTIAVSKLDVLIFLYDPEHDILLESSEFSLLKHMGEQRFIPFKTILALWLTLNYRYFCTGITDTMKTRGFTADFFKNVDEDKKHVYLEGLKFGGCRTGKLYPGNYLGTQDFGSPAFAVEGRPYKPCKNNSPATTN